MTNIEQFSAMLANAFIEGRGLAVADGSYKVARPLFIYAKKQHIGVSPGVKEFIAEYVSDKALGEDGYLADKGLVALPAAELEMVRATTTELKVLTADGLK